MLSQQGQQNTSQLLRLLMAAQPQPMAQNGSRENQAWLCCMWVPAQCRHSGDALGLCSCSWKAEVAAVKESCHATWRDTWLAETKRKKCTFLLKSIHGSHSTCPTYFPCHLSALKCSDSLTPMCSKTLWQSDAVVEKDKPWTPRVLITCTVHQCSPQAYGGSRVRRKEQPNMCGGSCQCFHSTG